MVDYQALSESLIRQLEAKNEMIRQFLEPIDELEEPSRNRPRTSRAAKCVACLLMNTSARF